MQENTFIVVDCNYRNRNELTLALGEMGYVVPADTLDDLGGRWPEGAWLLVHDEGPQLPQTQQALRSAGQYYPLVAYSKQASIAHIMDVLSDGAAGYLEWPTPGERLRRSLGNIMTRKWQGSTTPEQARAKQRVGQLSPREREVLSGVSEGYSSKEVARTLGISPRTVEPHRANVLTKLGVRNVAAAVRLSVEAQLDAGPAVTQERELAL